MRQRNLETEWQQTADDLDVPIAARQVLEEVLNALDKHHKPTADHSRRVGMLAVRIGKQLELPGKPLFYAGTLHDRGKLQVPVEYLNKKTEWTEADARRLRNHPLDGYTEMIKDGMIVTAGLVVRHHTFQPNKYPEQLPDAPPYMAASFLACARVIALADFYDAAHRPNSAGLSSDEEIKAKVLAHNPDMTDTIQALYANGVFNTSEPLQTATP